MKAEEILKIDFSKYKKIILNRVFVDIENAEIIVRNNDNEYISLEVIIDNKCIVRSFYDDRYEVEIEERDSGYLAISRKE